MGDDDLLNEAVKRNNSGYTASKLPLKKLKRHLFAGIISAVVITCGYLALFFFVSIWQVLAALTVMVAFNIWIMAESWQLYKNLNCLNITRSIAERGVTKNVVQLSKMVAHPGESECNYLSDSSNRRLYFRRRSWFGKTDCSFFIQF